MQTFVFLRPEWLALFVPTVLLLWRQLRRQDDLAELKNTMDPHLLRPLIISENGPASRIAALWLLFATLALAIITLCGPAWRYKAQPLLQNHAAIAAVLQVNESMTSDDLRPSRLERAVFKLKDLLDAHPDMRSLLIAYAGSAHLAIPLSGDAQIVYNFARALQPDIMPVKAGDALYDAVKLAAGELGTHTGSVVVFCDHLDPRQIERIRKDEALRDTNLIFYAVGTEELLPLDAFRKAADTLDADQVVFTTDDRDIQALTSAIQSQFEAAANKDRDNLEDGGYYLLFPLMALFALWFRKGFAAELWRRA